MQLEKKNKTEVQLIYNVLLVAGIQQSDSDINICIQNIIYSYILFFICMHTFSFVDYYKVLSIVPCAIQQTLSGYLLYIYIYSSEFESESESHSVVSDLLKPCGLYSPWNSPGQNIGVGSWSLLQGIFPTQGLNPGLPHCRQRILYQLSHQGSPVEILHES